MTVADDGDPARCPSRTHRRARPSAAPGAGRSVPAARFEPGKVAEARHRNPTWIVAGVLLVLLSALGGVLLFMSSDERTAVLVAARDLDPGRPVERADLRVQRVAVDDGVATLAAESADAIVGQHPAGRIPAGTMLAPAMFDAAVPLGPDEVVIGAALDPGEAPLAAAARSAAPSSSCDVDVPAARRHRRDGRAPTSLGAGTVWAVEPIATGQLWVSVRVDSRRRAGGLGGGGRGPPAHRPRGRQRMTLVAVGSVAGSPGATRFVARARRGVARSGHATGCVVEADADGGRLGAELGVGRRTGPDGAGAGGPRRRR